MDASDSVGVHISFGSIYHSPKRVGFYKKWQMWRPARYKQWQLNIVGFGLTKLLQTFILRTYVMREVDSSCVCYVSAILLIL